VLERDGKFYPIEIKAKTRPTRKDARNIQAFRETYSQLDIQPGLIIAPAVERYAVTSQDYVIPWDII